MILNCKTFKPSNDHKKLVAFVNNKFITKENIQAIVPSGNYSVTLYWWAENYHIDDEEDW